jgi:predicted small metal-binding protein
MKKSHLLAALAAASLALAGLSFAEGTSKSVASPTALKTVSCPPECGFMCRSHDEKELIEIVKAHAKAAHGKVLTDDQVRSFMQAEPAPAAAKTP